MGGSIPDLVYALDFNRNSVRALVPLCSPGHQGHGSGCELADYRVQRQLRYIQGALTLEG